MRGQLEVHIGEQRVVLDTGDSMTFDPDAPHAFRNPGVETTEILTVISPPNI